jgi:transcriptional regulator with XRE-family HTH domain
VTVADGGQGKDWLSTTLRDLRRYAGLPGTEVARRLGTSQRRISDLERGKYVPREDEINQLADLYGAKATMRRQMLRAVRDLTAQPPRARAMIARHGAYKIQQRAQRTESESARIRSFHPAIVIGLAQTPAYARAVFSAGGDMAAADQEKSITGRIARQEILGTGKDVSLLMTEGALRWQAINPAVMIEQLAHLAEISYRPGVRIGIIPWTIPVNVFPVTGFHILDSRAVVVGTDAATAFFTDSQDVSAYEKLWGELEALAVWDAEAREHIERISDDYRGLRNPRGSLRALTARPRRAAHELIAQHRPAAQEHRGPLILIVQAQPAVTWRRDHVTRSDIHPEPGPPPLPVLLIPLGPLAVQFGRADRLGDVIQGDTTAPPSARTTFGEAVLGEHPQRGRRRRRAQPGRPGDLGAAGRIGVEDLVCQRRRAAEHQERRVRRFNAASSPPPPADTVRIPIGDPERVAVGPGQLADAHQVDQRVRLITEYPQDARHGPVAQRGVQGQIPRAELDHARAGDHRRLAEGEQDQADGDSTAAPALDPLRVLGRAEDRREPLANQSVLR